MITQITSTEEYSFYEYNYLVSFSHCPGAIFIVVKEFNKNTPGKDAWGVRYLGALHDRRHDLLQPETFETELQLINALLKDRGTKVFQVNLDFTPVFMGVLFAARNPQNDSILEIAEQFEKVLPKELMNTIDTLDF